MIGRTAWPVRALAWGLVGLLVLPFLVIVPISLTDRAYLSLPDHALSLQHYRALFADTRWGEAFLRSLIIALCAAAISVLLGTLCAFGCWRLAPRTAHAVRALVLLPLIVPAIIQALAFYRTWSDLHLINTYTGVILANAILAIPFVFIAVSSALSHLDPRLELAASGLGASLGQTLRWVLIPLVLPGVFSGALFAFVAAFDELIVVLFITTRGMDTLPKMMWISLDYDLTPEVACIAVLIGLLTIALLLAEFVFGADTKRQAGNSPH